MDYKFLKKLGSHIRIQIEEWTKENLDVDPENLQGGCAIASYVLYKALIKLGCKPKFVMADSGFGSHCWIELEDMVIDLTATQFNTKYTKSLGLSDCQKVLIIKKNSYLNKIPQLKDYKDICYNKKAIESTKDWEQQSPLVYTKELKKFIRNINAENYS